MDNNKECPINIIKINKNNETKVESGPVSESEENKI